MSKPVPKLVKREVPVPNSKKSEPVDPPDEVLEHLRKPTNFQRLLDKLPIEQATIIEIACEQPQLFVEAARLRVQTKREFLRAEAYLDEVEAVTAKELRDRAASSAQKLTNEAVKERVTVDADVLQAQKEVRIASAKDEFGFNLLEAYRHRRDMIRVIADLVRIEGNDPAGSVKQFNADLSSRARAAVKHHRNSD